MASHDAQIAQDEPRVWVVGTRGKSTILAFVRALGESCERAVHGIEVPRGELAKPGPEDLLVVADGNPGEEAFELAWKAAKGAGRMVLDVDNPEWVRRSRELSGTITWVGAGAHQPALAEHLALGGDACFAQEGQLVVASGRSREDLLSMQEVPALLGGAAKHQIRNVAGAAAAGLLLDFSMAQLARGLRAVEESGPDRIGRCSSHATGGSRILWDLAPDQPSLEAVVVTAADLPRERSELLIGSVGQIDGEAWANELERLNFDRAWIAPGPGRGDLQARLAAAGTDLRPVLNEAEARRESKAERRAGDLLLALRCSNPV